MKGADQTPHMHRLICAFGVRMQQNQAGFLSYTVSLKAAKPNRDFAHAHALLADAVIINFTKNRIVRLTPRRNVL